MKKLLLIILVIGITSYLYQHPDKWRQAKKIGQDIPETIGIKPDSSVVYKWKDRDGNLVISSTPPDDDSKYEKIEYSHDTNVIPALDTGEDKKK